uniref:Uncharacterized protein n=1 Tax=Rhizophora mucronata TaxID=61149 RepID=A0A2P2JB09_RHIMU
MTSIMCYICLIQSFPIVIIFNECLGMLSNCLAVWDFLQVFCIFIFHVIKCLLLHQLVWLKRGNPN